jgi:serine/threonine-protein kinase
MPDPKPDARPDTRPDMSTRTMLILGGVMTVGVAAVLCMTTLVGRSGDDSVGAPARPAAVSQQETAAPAEAESPAPIRHAAITPHVAVPPTQGLDQRTARVRLRATRLVVAGVLRIPSAQPAGTVVRTYPAAGTGLPVGDRVTLYVSTGVPAVAEVTVPYLRGLTAAQASTAAGRLGLRVVVTGGGGGGGTVRDQTPTPGAQTPRGSEIAVTLHP